MLPDRLHAVLHAVLHVVYLVFNEGYSASSGAALTRPELSAEAIRLGWSLLELLPEPEVQAVLGLMLLHEARRAVDTTSSCASPVVELNRAAAIAMRDGPDAALALVEALLARGGSPGTTSPTPRRRTSCAGSGGRTRRAPPTSGRSRSLARSRSAGSSSGGLAEVSGRKA